MFRSAIKLAFGAALVTGLMAGNADAARKKIHHYHGPVPVYANDDIVRPPLTVNKRSFLDPGPVVPYGTESNYMVQNTMFATTPDQNFARSRFGNESLPRPLEVPGNSGPLFRFDSPVYYPYPD